MDSEEVPCSSSTATSFKDIKIHDTLNMLRNWRMKTVEECKKQQSLEIQRLLQLPKENQKKFEQLFENKVEDQHIDPESIPRETVPQISDISVTRLLDDINDSDTLQESSITGHLQRCFNDSTQSNVSFNGNKILHAPEKVPVFSELRNPQFFDKKIEEKDNPSAKTNIIKRPFLKKGTGLLRYKPNPVNRDQKRTKEEFPKVRRTQQTLKLKPALRKADAPSEQAKHIRFNIVDLNDDEDIKVVLNDDLSSVPKSIDNATDTNFYEKDGAEKFISTTPISPAKSDSSSHLESKELEQFEMLENYAQNNSFNSDSSLVQRIFQGELTKPLSVNENYSRLPSQSITSTKKDVCSSENTNSIANINLNKCFEEIQARKEVLQGVISDINPRIESLEKEISGDRNKLPYDSNISERSSTPVNLENINPSSVDDSYVDSSVVESSPEVKINHLLNDVDEEDEAHIPSVDCSCCNVNNIGENFYPTEDNAHTCNYEDKCACDSPEEISGRNGYNVNEKSKIQSKLLELENEIETYQQNNARLSALCKEREDIIRKLQKEKDDFNKYKETEMQKLEAHIQEEHRQIKRHKETFMRYQKLRKDNPTKKERDELSALRLEIEKLQEDLKRQKIKYNNDSRRWKNRMDVAEKERDTFKLENIRLEEQCQDLLVTLKTRMKKNRKALDDDAGRIDINENTKHTTEKKDAESQTETREFGFNVVQDSKSTSKPADPKLPKAKLPFSLVSDLKKNLGVNSQDSDIHVLNLPENKPCSEGDDLINNSNGNKKGNVNFNADSTSSVISVSTEAEFQEINHGSSIERVYLSGEREILYNSGTRKVISANGKSRKLFFHNGDTKEIFSDGQEIYTYVTGVIETTFPDRLKVTKFPNGQIQRHYPDGRKEVTLEDGTLQIILADGSEEIHTIDGHVIKKCADGIKIVEYANKRREIVTSSYKRIEYPDGAIKILYNNGKQEARYANGRIKLKDKEGKVLLDTKYLNAEKEKG